MRKVEEMQQYKGVHDLVNRISKLSKEAETDLIQTMVCRTYWGVDVTPEWLEKEVGALEKAEAPNLKLVSDHPIEDHFGSEVQEGDKYFKDQAGHVVLEGNWEDYLIEIGRVEFFRAIK